MAKLQNATPSEGMKLDYPPENDLMPNAEDVVSKKVERQEDTSAAVPISLNTGSDNFELWFKQDDTFDQPFVSMNCKIYTSDCMFPYTLKSHIYASLWQVMFDEHLREFSYMAEEAGVNS